MPDKDGKMADVVCGFKTLAEYEAGHPYFGAIVGRYGNRIAKGKFTLEGKIVLSVGVCKHAEHHGAEALGKGVVDRLDELHLRKIDLADSVFVLNVDGYIGESTAKEIEYAEKTGKPIEYLHIY